MLKEASVQVYIKYYVSCVVVGVATIEFGDDPLCRAILRESSNVLIKRLEFKYHSNSVKTFCC